MTNNKLYYIPIEPLHERYTAQWFKYFPEEFQKAGYDVHIIPGEPLTETIQTGTFLDINSTIAYKNSQMIEIAKLFQEGKIEQGFTFFFGDLEFWGLESLRLMADMNKINISIYGFMHAASYTYLDAFSIAEDYQKYTEIGWFQAVDGIFLGSEYHKRMIQIKRLDTVVRPPLTREDILDKLIDSSSKS